MSCRGLRYSEIRRQRRRTRFLRRAMLASMLVFFALCAHAGVCVAASSSKKASRSEALLNLINSERAEAGLPALVLVDELSKVAEKHAQDMIESRYFGHLSPDGATLAARLKSADVPFSKAAENLAGCTSVELAHKLLMGSSSHRANILSPRFSQCGIAVVEGGPYGMMIVEVFVLPPEPTKPENQADSLGERAGIPESHSQVALPAPQEDRHGAA